MHAGPWITAAVAIVAVVLLAFVIDEILDWREREQRDRKR